MIKFILGAWVLLFSIVASTQVFDFWRIDGSDGLAGAKFCEGSYCGNAAYRARVFYIYGDADRVLIRDSDAIKIGCGEEKSSHVKAKYVMRGDSVQDVRGRAFNDRQTSRTKIVNDLRVFLPCDAPKDAGAFGVAVAVPVWVKQKLSNLSSMFGVTAASFDVTR